MAKGVDEDVVGFDIAGERKRALKGCMRWCSPMNEPEVVDRFDGKDTFRHIEFRYILREGIVLDQPEAVS